MRQILDLFQPGRRLYLPGASGEALALAEALAGDPERSRGVDMISCLVPGVNSFDYASLAEDASFTTFLLPAALRPSFEDGRTKILPMAYTDIADYLDGDVDIDVAIAHVAPPDNDGLCSTGIAADFTPIVWRHARQRALIINPAMPVINHGPRLSLKDAQATIFIESPLVEGPAERADAVLDSIALRVASLIPDGAAVQFGLGGAPGAVWAKLRNHRNLAIASGLLSEGFMLLAESGALRADRAHRAGVAFGGSAFHRFLAEEDLVTFATVPETHGLEWLGRLNNFHAINSAIEVDLFGQVNLEWQNGRLASGVGGAPDFARGARRSPGGRSIIALPSTAKGGKVSRVVLRLDTPTISLCRNEIDLVVTEHGVANLRSRSLDERAEALIAVAAPDWREDLAARWSSYRSTL